MLIYKSSIHKYKKLFVNFFLIVFWDFHRLVIITKLERFSLNPTRIDEKPLPHECGQVLGESSSTSLSFKRRWKFNSSFSQIKRNSCKCRKNSVFNLDDCESKEVSSVIKYLRFRKVCSQYWRNNENQSIITKINN